MTSTIEAAAEVIAHKVDAVGAAVSHKVDQKAADVNYEVNKHKMNDSNAPIGERANAAVAAAGNAVSSHYHGAAAEVNWQEAKK